MKPYKWMSICVTLALLTGLLAGCAPSATPTALTPAPIKTEDAYPLEAASPESPAATAAAGEVPAELYPPEEPDRVVRLTDALGRAVELPGLPMNIVVVGKATSLLNNALFLFPEASERVKAYEQRIQTEHDFITDVFDPTGAKASLARDANAEQVAPLNPDLVIMKTYMRDSIGQGMEAIGIPVVYLDMETPESLYTDLRTIGAIFGNPERAEALVRLYQANTQRVADAIKDVPEYAYPTTVVLQYSSKGGESSFKVPPASYLQKLNGIRNANRIYPGQLLLVSPPDGKSSGISAAAAADSPTVYVVRKGDNLTMISRKFKVSVGNLKLHNGISGSDVIHPGMKLKIPAN